MGFLRDHTISLFAEPKKTLLYSLYSCNSRRLSQLPPSPLIKIGFSRSWKTATQALIGEVNRNTYFRWRRL